MRHETHTDFLLEKLTEKKNTEDLSVYENIMILKMMLQKQFGGVLDLWPIPVTVRSKA